MKNLSEKFQKIKFIVPIIAGLIGLWLIHKFFLTRNLDEKVTAIFFYFCDVWFSYAASKHWWKMARDEKYRNARVRWLELPIMSEEKNFKHLVYYPMVWLFVIFAIFLIYCFVYYLTNNHL